MIKTTNVAAALAAGVVAFGLTTAACGDGDGDDEPSAESAESEESTDGTEAPGDSTTETATETETSETTVATTVTTEQPDSSEPEEETQPTVPDAGEHGQLPQRVDVDTPPGHYEMSVGDSSTLTLPTDGSAWVDGVSVVLIEEVSVDGSNVRRWELRAVEEGVSDVGIAGTDIVWEIKVGG